MVFKLTDTDQENSNCPFMLISGLSCRTSEHLETCGVFFVF